VSANWSIVAIEGDVVDRLDSVLDVLRQRQIGDDFDVSVWAEARSFLESRSGAGDSVPVLACVAGTWTLLMDRLDQIYHSIFCHERNVQLLCRRLNTRVFVSFANGVTDTYGYRLYSGRDVRGVWIQNGRVQQLGANLPGEPTPSASEYNESSLIQVMHLLGFDPDLGVENSQRFVLFRVSPGLSTRIWDLGERSLRWVVERPRLSAVVQRVLDWLSERIRP
jgi:hypothetical protein